MSNKRSMLSSTTCFSSYWHARAKSQDNTSAISDACMTLLFALQTLRAQLSKLQSSSEMPENFPEIEQQLHGFQQLIENCSNVDSTKRDSYAMALRGHYHVEAEILSEQIAANALKVAQTALDFYNFNLEAVPFRRSMHADRFSGSWLAISSMAVSLDGLKGWLNSVKVKSQLLAKVEVEMAMLITKCTNCFSSNSKRLVQK